MVTNLAQNEAMAPDDDELEAYSSIRQYTEVWDGKAWLKLGVSYSKTPTDQITEVIEKIIKKRSRDNSQ